jgi:hypothetical protein
MDSIVDARRMRGAYVERARTNIQWQLWCQRQIEMERWRARKLCAPASYTNAKAQPWRRALFLTACDGTMSDRSKDVTDVRSTR